MRRNFAKLTGLSYELIGSGTHDVTSRKVTSREGTTMATRSVSILLGRDRICAVLEPLLGFELARERANNIAQVLAIAAHDPARVALDMLRRTGLGDVAGVAEQVSHAWSAGVRELDARVPACEQSGDAREQRIERVA
jgi:hypothetical protein